MGRFNAAHAGGWFLGFLVIFQRDIHAESDQRYRWRIGGHRASVMDQTLWYVFTLLNLNSILITARSYYRLQ